jgi:hypothetical protein
VVLALVLLIPSSFWAANRYTERLLNVEVDKIRAEGAPVSKNDIDARTIGIPESAGRRATKFLFTLEPDDFQHYDIWNASSPVGTPRVNMHLKYEGGYDRQRRRTGETWADVMIDWSPQLEERVRQVLIKDQDILAQITAIAKLPKEDPGIALTYAFKDRNFITAKLPNLLALRMSCDLLLWEAAIALKEGRTDDAMDGCTASMNFLKHLDNAPWFLITQMISVYIRSGIASLALEVLRDGDVSDAAAERFLAACAASQKGLMDAWDMERLSCMEIFSSIGKSWSEPYGAGLPTDEWWAMQMFYAMPVCRPWRQYDQVVALRMHDMMRSSVGTSYAETQRMSQPLSKIITELTWATPMTKWIVPNLLRTNMQYYRAEAMVKLSQVAIALKKCRRDTGSYPTELAALVPAFMAAVPMDPMTGKPLVYRLENGKLTLASAVDDSTGGGVEQFVWEVAQ